MPPKQLSQRILNNYRNEQIADTRTQHNSLQLAISMETFPRNPLRTTSRRLIIWWSLVDLVDSHSICPVVYVDKGTKQMRPFYRKKLFNRWLVKGKTFCRCMCAHLPRKCVAMFIILTFLARSLTFLYQICIHLK